MAKLASNNNKAIGPFTQAVTSPSLGFYYKSTKLYYPLITPASTLTLNGYIYSYDRSVGDTFGVSLSNTKYVVPNARVSAVTYDIPAGTYTPSAFKKLIDKYIPVSGSGNRMVSNSFTATVNNESITVNANTLIYNVCNASSGTSTLTYGVNFSGSYMTPGEAFSVATALSFTKYKVYVTDSTGVQYFNNYRNYNITVTKGIKFR